jgi:hypothetical protein
MIIYQSQIYFVGPIRAKQIKKFTNHSAFWKINYLIGWVFARECIYWRGFAKWKCVVVKWFEDCFRSILCNSKPFGENIYEEIAPIQCYQQMRFG